MAGALDTFFNNGGALPPAFVAFYTQTGAARNMALTAVSGELATGAQQAAFGAMNGFLGLLTDPVSSDRVGGEPNLPVTAYAEPDGVGQSRIAAAYGQAIKPPGKMTPASPWNVWAGVYGGFNRIQGDVSLGATTLHGSDAGLTVGADYRVSPDTVIGFATGGAGTGWSLASGAGSGRGEVFQSGVYGRTHAGAAYLSAGFAFAEHWLSTDRTVLGTNPKANFLGQSFATRVESGYRIETAMGGVTPYGALQLQTFRTPAYSETGGIFALNYASQQGDDTRGELGLRFDRSAAMESGRRFTLQARAAWAHDWMSNPAMLANFQTLAGTNFLVTGASPSRDAALISAGGTYELARGVALMAKVGGEFSARSSSYDGKAEFRVTW